MKIIVSVGLLATLAVALAACPQTVPPPGGGPGPVSNGETHSTDKVADGGACTMSTDCASGICEGEGCGAAGGTCAPTSRACTRDSRTYCGCDGSTFRSSGSCPGQRFSSRGECSGDGDGDGVRENLAAGATCGAASECASGICEGEGCGPDAGVCRELSRACTMDIRQYCGCDGVTFQGSGSCPGRLFAKRGACGK